MVIIKFRRETRDLYVKLRGAPSRMTANANHYPLKFTGSYRAYAPFRYEVMAILEQFTAQSEASPERVYERAHCPKRSDLKSVQNECRKNMVDASRPFLRLTNRKHKCFLLASPCELLHFL